MWPRYPQYLTPLILDLFPREHFPVHQIRSTLNYTVSWKWVVYLSLWWLYSCFHNYVINSYLPYKNGDLLFTYFELPLYSYYLAQDIPKGEWSINTWQMNQQMDEYLTQTRNTRVGRTYTCDVSIPKLGKLSCYILLNDCLFFFFF